MKVYIVVDAQNDFIDGVLGSPEAVAAVPRIVDFLKTVRPEDKVLMTQDTHNENYLSTFEGKKLPVPHCIVGSKGWEIPESIKEAVRSEQRNFICKNHFGTFALPSFIAEYALENEVEEVVIFGFCTDICVVSNALIIKNALPCVPITVISQCCAGTTSSAHDAALEVMRSCQIEIK